MVEIILPSGEIFLS